MLQAVGIRRILIGEDVNSLSRAVPQNPVGFPKGFVTQGLQMPGIRPFYKGVILPPGIKQRLYIGKGAQQHQCAPHADSWPRSQPDPMCQHIHPARFCVYSRQPGLYGCGISHPAGAGNRGGDPCPLPDSGNSPGCDRFVSKGQGYPPGSHLPVRRGHRQ